ncbi:SNF2-related protein [Clostridium sp. ETTB3]
MNNLKTLKTLKTQFNNIDKLTYEITDNFIGTLRNYQYKGFCYLKTLETLGFGGILGDEMGFGKTLQTIAFLSSLKNNTLLIVEPSSLLFN